MVRSEWEALQDTLGLLLDRSLRFKKPFTKESVDPRAPVVGVGGRGTRVQL